MTGAKRLMEAAGTAYGLTGYEEAEGAGTAIGRALRELQGVQSLDEDDGSDRSAFRHRQPVK